MKTLPPLHVLPTRASPCRENMILDWSMLEAYPEQNAPRFRHYTWSEPSATFGYSQRWQESVARARATGASLELCRRPTGGGFVDHRNDWTYALAIPASHPVASRSPIQAYQQIHDSIQTTVAGQSVEARLLKADESVSQSPESCFEAPSAFDVVSPTTGAKLAGAAQKRNRHGMLFQGSLDRGAFPEAFDWAAFEAAFTRELAQLLSKDEENLLRLDEEVLFEATAEGTIREKVSKSTWNTRR